VVDVWAFLGSGAGYYKIDADTMVRSSVFSYPLGSPQVQQGIRPITDGTYVYACASNTDVVYSVEIDTDTFLRTTVGDNPRMMADDGTTLWVANLNDNDVSRVTKSTMTRGTDEAIVNSGTLLWIDPYLWVFEAGASSATYRVYDPTTDTVIQTKTIVSALSDINDAAYYDGHVYVPVRFDDNLYKINTTTFTTATSAALLNCARVVSVGDWLYAITDGDVVKIDPTDLSTVDTLSGSYNQLTTNGYDLLWTVDNVNNLVKIDLDTFTVDSSSAIGQTPTGIVYAAAPFVPPTPTAGWVVGSVGW